MSRFADDKTLEYIAKLERELAEARREGMLRAAEIVRDAETMWGDDFTKKYGNVTVEEAITRAAKDEGK